jgi:hypothetical protein
MKEIGSEEKTQNLNLDGFIPVVGIEMLMP